MLTVGVISSFTDNVLTLNYLYQPDLYKNESELTVLLYRLRASAAIFAYNLLLMVTYT